MQEVDLATVDPLLEDLILGYYPGKLFEDQCDKDTSGDEIVYRFYNLERDILLGFVARFRPFFEYEIIDSKTGKRIETNSIEQGKKAIMQYAFQRLYYEPINN